MKLNFDTVFSKMEKSKEYCSNVGSPEEPIYEYRIIDGVKTLVDTGEKTNVYELIQSHAAETDINNIIARFLNGDQTVLNRTQGSYGDFSNLPKTYAELFARVQECENVFNNLPPEVRSEFGNSSAAFWSDFGSDRFVSIFDKLNPKTAEEVIKDGESDAK